MSVCLKILNIANFDKIIYKYNNSAEKEVIRSQNARYMLTRKLHNLDRPRLEFLLISARAAYQDGTLTVKIVFEF